MAGGKQHPIIAEAALASVPDEVAALCRREPDAFRVGSLWPDAMGARFSCIRIADYTLPDGMLDAARIREVFHNAENGVHATDELESWGVFRLPAWVVAHGAASPDFYARELRRAITAGDDRRAAFIVGFITHIAEYTAHYKSQEAMLTTMRPEGRVPVGVHKGQPFYAVAVAADLPGYDGNAGELAAAYTRFGAAELVDVEETAAACQRRLISEGVSSLFDRALVLQRAVVTCARPQELRDMAGEFRSLVARGLARTFELTRAACAEAVSEAVAPPPEQILFLIRGDLWLRHPLVGDAAAVNPGVARLRFAAALKKLGVGYRFASGDEPVELSGYPLVVSLEGWSSDSDAAVYDGLRAAAGGGGRVLLVGEPHRSRAEMTAWKDLCNAGGVTRGVEVSDMIRWLDRCSEPGNMLPGAADPAAEVLSALEEIRRSPLERQLRLNDGSFLAQAFGEERAGL